MTRGKVETIGINCISGIGFRPNFPRHEGRDFDVRLRLNNVAGVRPTEVRRLEIVFYAVRNLKLLHVSVFPASDFSHR